jgi:hypothetical protein
MRPECDWWGNGRLGRRCMQAHGGIAAMIRSPLRLSDNFFTTMAIWVYTTRYFVGDFRNTGTQNLNATK